MNGLLHARPDSARLPRAGIVHRLDKDTSGLMMVARSERAFERLTVAVAARSVHRRYVAVVHGETPIRFSIDAPIGRDPRDRLRMAVVDLAKNSGKTATTHFHVLAQSEQGVLVRCILETGRTHQIRVHMASLKLPLVGDAVYGGSAHPLMARQALHAEQLAFEHPMTGQALAFRSNLPEDFQNLLKAWSLSYNEKA
jgi:23S rRNA pseudouridine1911/1915/1917 synthase